MIVAQFAPLTLDTLAQRIVWILKGRLSVPGVLALITVAMIVWLVAGLRLRGVALLLWLSVPLLMFGACLCVAGPGRLFPKHGHEGDVILPIGERDAVTMLDLAGIGLATIGLALAVTLVTYRLQRHPHSIV